MKLSMRVKLVSILVVSWVMLAGSAWADFATVKGDIEAHGLTVSEASGTVITVGGSKSDVTTTLNIDTTGLTINWGAILAGTTTSLNGVSNFTLINISGTGAFNITGGEISLSGANTAPIGYPNNWPIMIKATGSANIAVSGGTVNMALSEGTAIDSATEVEITGGAVKAEHGTAISAPTVDIQATSGMQGSVFHSTDKIDVYGTCSFVTYDVCNWENLNISTATLKDGASVTITLPIIGRDNVEIVADNGAVLNSKFDSVGNITIGTDVVGVNSAVDAVAPNGETSVSELEKSGVPSNTIMPLEVFKVDDASTTGVFLKSYTMKLEKVAGYKVGELVVIKLMKNAPAAPEKLAREEPGSVGDGQFSVTDANGTPLPAGHVIQSGVDYIITIGIADGGNYDWDNNPGTIIDPAGIGAESGGGSGGGGGCNVGGYGVIALLLAAVGLVTRKSRKA